VARGSRVMYLRTRSTCLSLSHPPSSRRPMSGAVICTCCTHARTNTAPRRPHLQDLERAVRPKLYRFLLLESRAVQRRKSGHSTNLSAYQAPFQEAVASPLPTPLGAEQNFVFLSLRVSSRTHTTPPLVGEVGSEDQAVVKRAPGPQGRLCSAIIPSPSEIISIPRWFPGRHLRRPWWRRRLVLVVSSSAAAGSRAARALPMSPSDSETAPESASRAILPS
jgi:hypothetical protein